MLKILAIGGGEIHKSETLVLDRRACELTGKRTPKALFVPTASGDSEAYIQSFSRLYGGKLGCRVQALCLLSRPTRKEIGEKVREADLIYVGGGNTDRMMRWWRRSGLDEELIRAARRGTVLCGLSAGGICWFRYGQSDSRKFSGGKDWSFIRVRGLDLVPLLFCPHYRSEKREAPLRRYIALRGGRAVGCEDLTGIEIIGSGYRILAGRRNAGVYFLRRVKGRVLAERLQDSEDYRPLAELTGVS